MSNLKKTFLLVTLIFTGTCNAGEWFEGGTLTEKGVLIWQEASFKNKIASSSSLVIAMYNNDLLKTSITNDIKKFKKLAPYSIELAICIDGSTKKRATLKENKQTFTLQTVKGMAAICVMLMGWAK